MRLNKGKNSLRPSNPSLERICISPSVRIWSQENHSHASHLSASRTWGSISTRHIDRKINKKERDTHPRLSRVIANNTFHKDSNVMLAFGHDIIGRRKELQMQDTQACFLEDLACGTFLERFVGFEVSARQTPCTCISRLSGLIPVLLVGAV